MNLCNYCTNIDIDRIAQEYFDDRESEFEMDEVFALVKQLTKADIISRSEAIKAIEKRAKRIKNEDTLNGLAGAVAILFELPPAIGK